MTKVFENVKVSVALLLSDGLLDDPADLVAILEQDPPPAEVLLVDDRGPEASLPPALAELPGIDRVVHLPGTYANRAARYNAALRAASGDYLLVVFNGAKQVTLRRSCIRTLVMAATRHEPVSMVYADYERIEADGRRHDVHLLDWHEGRLRDTVDLGAVLLFPLPMLRGVGGFRDEFKTADLYDLRLRICGRRPPAHVANRYAGALYTVKAPAKAHNVFDYLLADKECQQEMEVALSAHLKRIGAFLTPGAHVQPVEYTAEEQGAFSECVASVVIPVNNRPEFIGRAIESVRRQTLPAVEVIVVVNGGASDPTADAVRRYMPDGEDYQPDAPPVRLIVLDVNNLGLCMNSGIAASRGKYYVQLDSDDRLKPDAIEKLIAVFDSDPTIGMVIGSYEVATLDDRTGEITPNADIPVVTHDEWTAENGRNNLLRINGAGAPRAAHIKAIAEAGWFGVNDDPSCRNYGEDYDLVLRVSERHTIGRVWDPIYEVIRHSGGTDHSIDQATIDRNDNAKDHMRLAALQRRRKLNGKSTT
ncbi:MAG: glycosyltransferase [bacterium]|nr:glycosyltransferase [bacterium]